MSQPRAGWPPALAPAVAAAAGCGSAPAATAAARRAALAVAGHLPGHRGRHLGRRGDGRLGRQYNNFWQLFVRPAGSTRWKLVTPPGHRGQRRPGPRRRRQAVLVTGFRPSQYLTYSPLIITSDAGQAWSSPARSTAPWPTSPTRWPPPASGHLLALLTDGTAELAAPGYQLDDPGHPAVPRRDAAGRRCGLQNLTAAAFAPPGIPLLGGTCGQPGTAGIFAGTGGTWHAAGPAIPAALAGQDITVSRLTRTAQGLPRCSGGHRAGRQPARRHCPQAQPRWPPASAAPRTPWPSVAVTLTVWQHAPGGTTWAKIQVINVPIPYGSSS